MRTLQSSGAVRAPIGLSRPALRMQALTMEMNAMSVEEELHRVLSQLSADSLEKLVLDLARSQSPDARSSVSLQFIVERLAKGTTIGVGADGWDAQIRLQEAIRETVGSIPGMTYVVGDS